MQVVRTKFWLNINQNLKAKKWLLLNNTKTRLNIMYLIEKQERELQEAWEGLSLGNSIQPHLLKLKIILKLISCKMHFFKQKEPNNWTSRGETEVLWYSYWNQQKCNNWYSHWNLKANNLNLTKQKLKIPQKWWKKKH